MSRGVLGKLEVEVDIKSGGDVFHEIFTSKPHHISLMSPSKVHGCDLHEGEFGKEGSVLFFNYTLDGKKCVAKHRVEAIDEENKYVKVKGVEGNILDHYKSFEITLQVIPRDEITAVKWIIEFEKKVDDGPYPTGELDFFIGVTRDIEAHHHKP